MAAPLVFFDSHFLVSSFYYFMLCFGVTFIH